jgi:hypothetical protein
MRNSEPAGSKWAVLTCAAAPPRPHGSRSPAHARATPPGRRSSAAARRARRPWRRPARTPRVPAPSAAKGGHEIEHQPAAAGKRGGPAQRGVERLGLEVVADAQAGDERGRARLEPGPRQALVQPLRLEVDRREGQACRDGEADLGEARALPGLRCRMIDLQHPHRAVRVPAGLRRSNRGRRTARAGRASAGCGGRRARRAGWPRRPCPGCAARVRPRTRSGGRAAGARRGLRRRPALVALGIPWRKRSCSAAVIRFSAPARRPSGAPSSSAVRIRRAARPWRPPAGPRCRARRPRRGG